MSDNIYLGNPNLKRANTQIQFTEEQIIEFLKCKEDPVYFAKNYIKIVTLDHGLQPFKMYPFQEKLIKNFHNHRFNICKMPRQTGKSTTCVSYLLHYAIFNDNVNIAILANKASTARDLLQRLQLAYEQIGLDREQRIKLDELYCSEKELREEALFELQQRRGRLREVIRQQVQEERSRTAESSEGSQPTQTDQHPTKRSRDEVVPKRCCSSPGCSSRVPSEERRTKGTSL